MCNLHIKLPGKGKIKLTLHRKQLISTKQISVSVDGEATKDIHEKYRYGEAEEGTANGLFDSYTLMIADYDKDTMDPESVESIEYDSIRKLRPIFREIGLDHGPRGEIVVLMRRYNLNKRRGSARGQYTRLKNYIDGKRNKVTIKEDAAPSFKGVLSLVTGVFTFLLTLLIGQFWDKRKGFVSRQGRKTIKR